MKHQYSHVPSLLKWLAVSVVGTVMLGTSAVQASPIPVVSALPFVTVAVGNTVTIPISITGATDLTSWQLDVGYLSSTVDATAVTEDSFMSAFGLTSFTPGFLLPGVVSGVADSYVDLPPDPSGNGLLVDITFQALAPGVSPLNLSNVFLDLSDSGFTTQNGQITVTGSAVPVPEPTTLALLTTGLTLLVRRRRRTCGPREGADGASGRAPHR